MNYLNFLVPFSFFISFSLETALPWQIGRHDDDEYLQNVILDSIQKTEANFRCDCVQKSSNDTVRKIYIVIYENTFQIFRLDEKNQIFQKRIINCRSRLMLIKKITEEIVNLASSHKAFLYFCFVEMDSDLKLIEMIVGALKHSIVDVNISNQACPNLSQIKCLNINFAESKTCGCLTKFISDKALPDLIDEILDSRNYEFMDFETFYLYRDSEEFFLDFHKKYFDTKLYWNLLKYLLNDKEFGSYFVFFIDTCQDKINFTTNSTIVEMCDKIKNKYYGNLQEADRKEWKRFACNSLYSLLFQMDHPFRFDIIQDLLVNYLKWEIREIIPMIKNNIRKKFDFHLLIINNILKGNSASCVEDKFFKNKCERSKKFIEIYCKNIERILDDRTDTFKYTLSINLKENKNI